MTTKSWTFYGTSADGIADHIKTTTGVEVGVIIASAAQRLIVSTLSSYFLDGTCDGEVTIDWQPGRDIMLQSTDPIDVTSFEDPGEGLVMKKLELVCGAVTALKDKAFDEHLIASLLDLQ